MLDLKGAFSITDDIIVHRHDTNEHDRNLEALLKKSHEKNVVFNKAKCEFNEEYVVYYGLMFSKDGVSPDPNKVQAIKMVGQLRNATELNSFLCTVRYSLMNFISASKYRRAVCRLGELIKGKFKGRKEHTEAFNKLKKMLSSNTVQAYFNPEQHKLHVDGCPMELAAPLT